MTEAIFITEGYVPPNTYNGIRELPITLRDLRVVGRFFGNLLPKTSYPQIPDLVARGTQPGLIPDGFFSAEVRPGPEDFHAFRSFLAERQSRDYMLRGLFWWRKGTMQTEIGCKNVIALFPHRRAAAECAMRFTRGARTLSDLEDIAS